MNSLSSQIEANLLPRCTLSCLDSTLVLIRILLHDLGSEFSQERSLRIARGPVGQHSASLGKRKPTSGHLRQPEFQVSFHPLFSSFWPRRYP